MAERLEQSFDAAVEASLAAVEPDQLDAALLAYLRDVHALEGQAVKLLEAGAERVDDEHLERPSATTSRRRDVTWSGSRSLLEERGARPSLVKDAMLKAGGLNLSAFFGAQPDSTTKLAGFAFAFEHLEVAAYELLHGSRPGPATRAWSPPPRRSSPRSAARPSGWPRAGTAPTCRSAWPREATNYGPDKGSTMKALTFHGKRDVRVDEVPDPKIEEPTDAIVRITSTAICGSDLHLYEVLGMFIDEGDILGHEPMGIVEEVGSEVSHIKAGDRVVIPFNISCGHCWMCDQQLFAQCETTQVREQDKGASLFGYTKLYGAGAGRPGRVPARAAGALRADQGARERSAGRALPLPLRRPAHRLAGGRVRGDPQGRQRRRLRPRADRPDVRAHRPAPGRRAGDRRRPRAGAPGDGRAATASRRSTSTSTTTCRDAARA